MMCGMSPADGFEGAPVPGSSEAGAARSYAMKSMFHLRLWMLIVALVLVSAGTIYGLWSAWRRVQSLETRLTRSQVESFRLAGEIQTDLLTLNDSILRYVIGRDPREWDRFGHTSDRLSRWIADHDPNRNPGSPLATQTERRLFRELGVTYDDYRKSARAVHGNAAGAIAIGGQFEELDNFDSDTSRMLDLTQQLADAHRAAEAEFLVEANASLASLRGFLNVGFGMLLALVAAIGWVIYRDMIAPLRTKLVHSQNLLERQEKLATLGTLAAGIAHEIRNPLTSLKARLYTLEKHLQVVPAARKDIDIIGGEISRLERIVREVLNFARPSDPKLETIGAGSLLAEIQGLMSPNLESEAVRLMLEADPGLFIRADNGTMKQVLINLVRNAADATEGAGTITLRARAARADFDGDGQETDAVILEVIDNGNGIPPEVEKRLFDPFFSTKETGTGLGLSIAARIVESHGGMLQYRTRPGRGTTFGVVLPRESGHTGSRETGQANGKNSAD